MTLYNAGAFELGQNPVHRRQADAFLRLHQLFVDVFSTHVMGFGLFQHFEHLQAR